MRRYVFLFFISSIIFSCGKEDKIVEEISKINIDFNIERFDVAFAEATPEQLPELKKVFPFLFPEKYNDVFWIQQMQDTLQQEIQEQTIKAFKDLKTEKQELQLLFQHLKYYFPEFNTPRVITVASDVDYRRKVVVTDSIVLLPLPNYLGKDHYFYKGIQNYIAQDLTPELMVVDVANTYAQKQVYQTKRKSLLQEMVYFGKTLYFLDKMLPFKTEAQRISYNQEQLDWAKVNEEYIWRYFIEKELLYSTDSKLPTRFINSGPFSKFYLEEIDAESPDKIGQFIGWQIVKAFMKNNDVSFKDMLGMNADDIFNKANYKPRR